MYNYVIDMFTILLVCKLVKPLNFSQELEVMMDLFHSFDDTNSGVLKKAGFMSPFGTPSKEQETK